MTRIYTQGSFDILHRGHINFLRQAKALGDHLTVSLLSDRAYEEYRGYEPAKTFEDRYAVLSHLTMVDHVLEGDNTRTKRELLSCEADIAAISTDWVTKNIYTQWRLDQEWLDDHAIRLVYLPHTPGISSTQIKEGLK